MKESASMKVLSSTESLSSLSGRPIPATIVQEGEKVYIIREEENGRRQKGLLEKDVQFYMRSRKYLPEERIPLKSLTLYVTSDCNLQCPVCYEDEIPEDDDMSLDQITEILKKYKGKAVVLGGKEPTCREDLPEIVRLASRNNPVLLLTNGLKLADLKYVRQLKSAGLSRVAFSFNGFRDDIYMKINGSPLLGTKLRALNNLKREGIGTNLSMLLVRGVNDDQLKDMVRYCMENRSFIHKLRIRTLAHLGRYVEEMPYTLSEMVDLMATSLGFSLDDFMKEELLGEMIKNVLHIPSYNRICSIRFHIRGRRNHRPAAIDFNSISVDRSSFKEILIIGWAIRHYGLLYLKEFIQKLPVVFKNLLPLPLLPVEFRSWPNLSNLDLIENRKCPSGFYRDGRLQPFCYANITREIESQAVKRNKEKS